MHYLFDFTTRLHVYGFNLLEWCGVVAILLGVLLVLIKTRQRMFRNTPGDHPPVALGPLGGSPSARSKAKILVVDDDPLALEMMDHLLGKLGYHVVGVNTGQKAIDYMQQNGADLILLDMVMGKEMDGIETYRQIRARRPFQRVMVISGHASPEKVAAIRHLGVEHYLIKPVPIAILAQTIRSELDRP